MKRPRLFGHALRLMLRGALHRPYEVITLTVGALAVTLLVLVVLGIKAGLERTLDSAGSPDLLIVLGNGAEAEITSAFAIPEVNAITTAARMADDAPLLKRGLFLARNRRISDPPRHRRSLAVGLDRRSSGHVPDRPHVRRARLALVVKHGESI